MKKFLQNINLLKTKNQDTVSQNGWSPGDPEVSSEKLIQLNGFEMHRAEKKYYY